MQINYFDSNNARILIQICRQNNGENGRQQRKTINLGLNEE